MRGYYSNMVSCSDVYRTTNYYCLQLIEWVTHFHSGILIKKRVKKASVTPSFRPSTPPFSLFNAFNHWRGSKKRRRRTARGQMERTVSLTTTTVECAYMQFFFFACSLFGLEKASFPSHKKSWRRPWPRSTLLLQYNSCFTMHGLKLISFDVIHSFFHWLSAPFVTFKWRSSLT